MTFPRLAAQSTRVRIVQLVDARGDPAFVAVIGPNLLMLFSSGANYQFSTQLPRLFDSRESLEFDLELVDARREAEVAKHLTENRLRIGVSLENA